MQAYYPRAFEREMGSTVEDLRRQLPGAARGAPILWHDDGADVTWAHGTVRLRWQAQTPRRIALITLPRLRVQFDFDASIDEAERQRWMRHFDLFTQRGGG